MSLRILIFIAALFSSSSIAAPARPAIRVAAIGDSLTLMSESRGERGYGHHLEYLLQGAGRIAAVGTVAVNSTTSSQHLSYWTTRVKGQGYTHLILWSGYNDAYTAVATATTTANIQQITNEALAEGMTVVIVSITPWSGAPDWTSTRQTACNAIDTYTSTMGSVTRINAWTVLGQSGGSVLASAYDAGDGVHINSAGALALAQAIKTALGL